MSQELNIRATRGYGPNYAWIGAGAIWADDARVIVKRLDAQKQQYLGNGAWIDDAVPLEPVFVSTENGATHLLIGPPVCERLQPGQWLEITVVEAGNEHRFDSVIWQGSRTLGDPFVPKKGPPKTIIATSPAADPPPDSLAGITQSIKSLDTGLSVKKKPDKAIPDAPKRKGKVLPIAIAALAVIVLIAGGMAAYLVYLADCTLMPFSCPAEEHVPATDDAAGNAAQNQFALATATGSGIEQWRSVISSPDSTAEQLIALGQWLWSEPEDPVRFDTGYDALYTAATERNSTEAQMIIAAQADPLAEGAEPDSGHARTALIFYRMAADAGNAEAVARLEELCAWADAQTGATAADLRQAREMNCS